MELGASLYIGRDEAKGQKGERYDDLDEINARYGIKDHVWQTDGVDSTGFGVAPNFGCCTANFVQVRVCLSAR